ncbi:unnamed protein product [Paramecium octaurelia]|uniref:Uncharacterized protein n=1 Tax=Paramecium octaurelia TaxID=43137 RepID=A0A8S1UFW6_PAROT|nr:unnamed protein product [Paramecium octaurelia]
MIGHEFVLYNIKDSQITQKLESIQLPCIPTKMIFLEQSQQIYIKKQRLFNIAKFIITTPNFLGLI